MLEFGPSSSIAFVVTDTKKTIVCSHPAPHAQRDAQDDAQRDSAL